MNRATTISIWVIIIVIIAVGAYFAVSMNSPASTYNPPSTITNQPSSGQQTTPAQQPSPTPSSTPQTFSVAISNFAFSPSSLTIKIGDSVTWTNQDSSSHTVTSDSGSELSSGVISQGEMYSHTFSTAGTYTYHCSIHPSMKATIVVQ